ncbi:TPA: hypothetical protein NJ199_004390 [Vibrio parahaemolyticus]|nr:hypothetical protein [Vibrio parahaemolyticus]
MKVNKTDIISAGLSISCQYIPQEIKPWSETKRLLDGLLKAKSARCPFSMIRLGDGEGRLLGYPRYYNDAEISSQCLSYQYGRDVIPLLKEKYPQDHIFHGAIKLKYSIINAVDNADFIGVPSWIHFKPLNEKNENAQFAQALCLTETVNMQLDDKEVFDHYIFRPFQSDGFFSELLGGEVFLGVISHTDISKQLELKFGIDKVVHYKIPGHQSFMKNDEPQYPDYYQRLLNDIKVPFEGAMFIVSAGYLGKLYCDHIKRQGGMAIDIGAIFDAWTGIGRPNETKNTQLRL